MIRPAVRRLSKVITERKTFVSTAVIPESSNHKPWAKTILLGVLSGGMYVLLFAYGDMATKYFTRGSWYACLPIATAFVFTFVHSAFAAYLLSAVGFEASNNHKTEPTED